MSILVIGASGLIGSAVVAGLAARGRLVVGLSRGPLLTLQPVRHVRRDLAQLCAPSDWLPLLEGIEAVVNCAGLLQDAPGQSVTVVHETAPRALFAACEQAGVRRVIQISALGAESDAPTDFSKSKAAGDRALMASALDWVILRPSVVIGGPVYGGSALLRGLAALPIRPVAPNAGAVQVVHLDDLVETIAFFLTPRAPGRVALDLVGPRTWPFDDLVALFRRWLGWPPARRVEVPGFLFGLLYRLGDLAGLLGWRPPVRSTTGAEIERGVTGDPGPWIAATGIVPRDIAQTLAAQPASVQERWFARLYLAKPFVLAALVLFWIATALIALGPGWRQGIDLINEAGLFGWPATLAAIGGALVDIAVGAAIALRRTSRWGLRAGIVVTIGYAIACTVLVPRLWADPLGPILKLLPLVAVHLAALAFAEDR